jgi:hypothetical protein
MYEIGAHPLIYAAMKEKLISSAPLHLGRQRISLVMLPYLLSPKNGSEK